jgi:hypothetical protein
MTTPSIVPTLHEDYDNHRITIVSPESLAGREVVAVDGWPCGALTSFGKCGLILGHKGLCWDCSPELIETAGPWAIRKVTDVHD